MSDSSNTQHEYCPESSPKRKDWAQAAQNTAGPYGSGPGLTDPNDDIQNSDDAYQHHLEKQAKAVGDGPTARRPSQLPDVEHREHARVPTLSPPHENPMYQMATAGTSNSMNSTKTKAELDHHNTLSSLRTKIGLEHEPPIVDGHEAHDHLAWSSVRYMLREPFAEFFGTFIMVLSGMAVWHKFFLVQGRHLHQEVPDLDHIRVSAGGKFAPQSLPLPRCQSK